MDPELQRLLQYALAAEQGGLDKGNSGNRLVPTRPGQSVMKFGLNRRMLLERLRQAARAGR